ncbi:lipocalin-like domain-containing protein [Pseudaestuariivita sp.]|uniref:lipocalin-like domain-containing protein n=1 Tax=Pseudaestuariivita sp. TaxID=2211669 RepID=UPI0040590882
MRRRPLILGLAAAPGLLEAQGFAGLGTDAEGFAVPQRGAAFTFPEDHGAHPAYRIEWWYLTVTLEGDDGRAYGVQWTLFRSAFAPNGAQLWMGHAALTTPDAHLSTERFSRGRVGTAGVVLPLEAWIDEWRLASVAAEGDAMDRMRVSAGGPAFRYALDLEAEGPLVFHGDAGYSVKSEDGQASFYYSQPFFRASGEVETQEGAVQVTGQGWLDREWSSQPLSPDQSGWDWFSLTFAEGLRLMAFGLRSTDGRHFTSGTWILPDGQTQALGPGEVVLTPLEARVVQGRRVPLRWRLAVARFAVDIEVVAERDDCWMDTTIRYWEGPVRATGSHTGRGYLEMTGYDGPS